MSSSCLQQAPHWTAQFLPLFSVLVSSIIVIWVAVRQHRATREKLRLDLYDRRFAVYEKALAFHLALEGPPESFQTDAFRSLQRAFIQASRESQFLFADTSGIFKLLGKLHVAAFKIKAVGALNRNDDPRLYLSMSEDATKARQLFDESIPALETALAPYLNFQKVLT